MLLYISANEKWKEKKKGVAEYGPWRILQIYAANQNKTLVMKTEL